MNYLIEVYMKDSGLLQILDTEKESEYGRMGESMKEVG